MSFIDSIKNADDEELVMGAAAGLVTILGLLGLGIRRKRTRRSILGNIRFPALGRSSRVEFRVR